MLDYEESVQRSSYKQWILNYLKERGVTYTDWKSIQPLYNRYRARCLKLKPTTEHAFRNLCTFESTRANTKYDMHANLLEGKHKIHFCKKDQKRKYSDIQGTGQQARANYKLNYQAPPKKEDFEAGTDYRLAYKDWSYLKYALADYEAVKNLAKAQWKRPLVSKETDDFSKHRCMFQYPFLVRYALRCLSGEYPIEAYPECLSDYREELQNLLDKIREAFEKEGPANFKFYM